MDGNTFRGFVRVQHDVAPEQSFLAPPRQGGDLQLDTE